MLLSLRFHHYDIALYYYSSSWLYFCVSRQKLSKLSATFLFYFFISRGKFQAKTSMVPTSPGCGPARSLNCTLIITWGCVVFSGVWEPHPHPNPLTQFEHLRTWSKCCMGTHLCLLHMCFLCINCNVHHYLCCVLFERDNGWSLSDCHGSEVWLSTS